MLLNRRDERRFVVVSDQLVDGYAVFEEDDGGDAANVETGRGCGILVHVHLEDLHFAFELVGDFLDGGGEHPAGAAPFRPEVHENGNS